MALDRRERPAKNRGTGSPASDARTNVSTTKPIRIAMRTIDMIPCNE